MTNTSIQSPQYCNFGLQSHSRHGLAMYVSPKRGSLRELVRSAVRRAYATPLLGRIAKALYREFDHYLVMKAEENLRRNGVSEVVAGPFQGLHYPPVKHLGYASLPMKLGGLYEHEIHDMIYKVSNNEYDHILNIGAADGYYTIGLLRMFPTATCIAWEAIPFMADYVDRIAAANGVKDRLEIRGFCTPSELSRISLRGKTLIFCDCEGGENDLLNREILAGIDRYDILVETHDVISAGTSDRMKSRFTDTHEIRSVLSKGHTLSLYSKDFLRKLAISDTEAYRVLDENRYFEMEWLLLTQKDA